MPTGQTDKRLTCPYCGKVGYVGSMKTHIRWAHETDHVARFWSRVDKSGGPDACWPYMGARESNGYGYPTWGAVGKHALGHRLAYQLVKGPIPKGKLVCHTCDNPPCCNPAHLWVGTKKTNCADMYAKGRDQSRGEKNFHARLTTPKAIEIYALRGKMTQSETARLFDISEGVIQGIWSHRIWKHIHAK